MNIVPTFPRPQLELLHKQRTGFFGEDCTPTEEFRKKLSGHSGEHEIIPCLPIGEVGFNLLVGMAFGIEHKIVDGDVIGSTCMHATSQMEQACKEGGWQTIQSSSWLGVKRGKSRDLS